MIYGPREFYDDGICNSIRHVRVQKIVDAPIVASANNDLQALAASPLVLNKLLYACCRHFKTNPKDIKSPCRKSDLANCRHMFGYFAHTFYRRNFTAIGRFLGRDRSTVMYGITKILEAPDGRYDQDIDAIKLLLGGMHQ